MGTQWKVPSFNVDTQGTTRGVQCEALCNHRKGGILIYEDAALVRL
jgi:hypothetical protein